MTKWKFFTEPVSEIKYLLDSLIKILKMKDENFSKFEDKSIESIQSKERRKFFKILTDL